MCTVVVDALVTCNNSGSGEGIMHIHKAMLAGFDGCLLALDWEPMNPRKVNKCSNQGALLNQWGEYLRGRVAGG